MNVAYHILLHITYGVINVKSEFITHITGKQGNMLTTEKQGNMLTTWQQGNMLTTGQQGNMLTTGQQGNMLTTLIFTCTNLSP